MGVDGIMMSKLEFAELSDGGKWTIENLTDDSWKWHSRNTINGENGYISSADVDVNSDGYIDLYTNDGNGFYQSSKYSKMTPNDFMIFQDKLHAAGLIKNKIGKNLVEARLGSMEKILKYMNKEVFNKYGSGFIKELGYKCDRYSIDNEKDFWLMVNQMGKIVSKLEEAGISEEGIRNNISIMTAMPSKLIYVKDTGIWFGLVDKISALAKEKGAEGHLDYLLRNVSQDQLEKTLFFLENFDKNSSVPTDQVLSVISNKYSLPYNLDRLVSIAKKIKQLGMSEKGILWHAKQINKGFGSEGLFALKKSKVVLTEERMYKLTDYVFNYAVYSVNMYMYERYISPKNTKRLLKLFPKVVAFVKENRGEPNKADIQQLYVYIVRSVHFARGTPESSFEDAKKIYLAKLAKMEK